MGFEQTREKWLAITGLPPERIPELLVIRGTRYPERCYQSVIGQLTDPVEIGRFDGIGQWACVGGRHNRAIGFAAVTGATMASEIVHIFGMLGAKGLIYTSTCRPLHHDIRSGDWLVVMEACCGDGVSGYYQNVPEIVSHRWDGFDVAGFKRRCRKLIHWGRVYSTAAPLRCDNRHTTWFSRRNCWAVDTQTAAVFATAKHFGLNRMAVLMADEDWPLEKILELEPAGPASERLEPDGLSMQALQLADTFPAPAPQEPALPGEPKSKPRVGVIV